MTSENPVPSRCSPRFFLASALALVATFQARDASAEVFHYVDRSGRMHRVQLVSNPGQMWAQASAEVAAPPSPVALAAAPSSALVPTPAAVPEATPAAAPVMPAVQPTTPAFALATAPTIAPAAPARTPQAPAALAEFRLPVVPQPPTELPSRSPFLPLIREASEYYSIPFELLLALVKVESNFNAQAISRKGAIGLVQLMPETAAELGVTDLFDPRQNVFAGARYLRMLINEFEGQVALALAAYNAGAGSVRRAGGIPAIQETQAYVPAVLSAYRGYQSASARSRSRELPW